jgi:hypothetical protein
LLEEAGAACPRELPLLQANCSLPRPSPRTMPSLPWKVSTCSNLPL